MKSSPRFKAEQKRGRKKGGTEMEEERCKLADNRHEFMYHNENLYVKQKMRRKKIKVLTHNSFAEEIKKLYIVKRFELKFNEDKLFEKCDFALLKVWLLISFMVLLWTYMTITDAC